MSLMVSETNGTFSCISVIVTHWCHFSIHFKLYFWVTLYNPWIIAPELHQHHLWSRFSAGCLTFPSVNEQNAIINYISFCCCFNNLFCYKVRWDFFTTQKSNDFETKTYILLNVILVDLQFFQKPFSSMHQWHFRVYNVCELFSNVCDFFLHLENLQTLFAYLFKNLINTYSTFHIYDGLEKSYMCNREFY